LIEKKGISQRQLARKDGERKKGKMGPPEKGEKGDKSARKTRRKRQKGEPTMIRTTRKRRNVGWVLKGEPGKTQDTSQPRQNAA